VTLLPIYKLHANRWSLLPLDPAPTALTVIVDKSWPSKEPVIGLHCTLYPLTSDMANIR